MSFTPAENYNAQQQDLISYWQLYTMQYFLQRIEANLSIINAPPNSVVITVVNVTLFQLAAQYYGDATQWPVIANANNLRDPMILKPTKLIIPAWNQQDTGGIL